MIPKASGWLCDVRASVPWPASWLVPPPLLSYCLSDLQSCAAGEYGRDSSKGTTRFIITYRFPVRTLTLKNGKELLTGLYRNNHHTNCVHYCTGRLFNTFFLAVRAQKYKVYLISLWVKVYNVQGSKWALEIIRLQSSKISKLTRIIVHRSEDVIYLV